MKKILSILTMSLIIVSCTSDDINPDQYFAGGSKIVGFTKAFETVSYFADEGQVTLDFPVSLIGSGNGQTLSEDIEITYQIDPASSTATEGVEFEFANTSGKLVIPAGSTFVGFPLKVNTGQLDPVAKTELIVKLTSATNNTVVGQQYETLKIIFVGCQSTLAGNYTLSVKRADVATPYIRTGETITQTSVNNFLTRTSGNYAFGQLAPAPLEGYNFVDICGDITIPQQNLANFYSNILQPIESNEGDDGEVIDANSFVTRYEIGFTGNTVWRQFTGTYTRI